MSSQYVRPIAGSNSGSVVWGSYGKYDQVDAIVSQSAASPDWYATGSNVGQKAFYVAASTTGNYTASMGGGGSLGDFIAGQVYEIGLHKVFVSAGTLYALYKNKEG